MSLPRFSCAARYRLPDVGNETIERRESRRPDPVERLRCRSAVRISRLPSASSASIVEQLFLCRGLADDELDVVHQQQVEAAQAGLEFQHLIGFERLDEFDHEALGAAVENAAAGMGLQEGVPDRVQQVRLALPVAPLR